MFCNFRLRSPDLYKFREGGLKLTLQAFSINQLWRDLKSKPLEACSHSAGEECNSARHLLSPAASNVQSHQSLAFLFWNRNPSIPRGLSQHENPVPIHTLR